MIGRTAHTLRSAAALGAGRPAYAAGIRASIATILPLASGHLFGDASAGTWMSLGGFSGALSDRGGSYASRARVMAALTIGGALTALIGALVAGHLIAALVATFAICFVASLARVWGAPGVSLSGAMLSAYVVSLGIGTAHGSSAPARGIFIVLGGVWAMIVALVLWPLRPYRPARIAVAECYRALARYVREIGQAAVERHTAEWPVHAATPGITSLRTALEQARSVLVQLRRGRPGGTERGERLLILGELADQLFGHVVAASELLSAVQRSSIDDTIHESAVRVLQRIAETADEIAAGIEDEEKHPRIDVTWSGETMRAEMRPNESASPDPHYEYVAVILDRAAQFASAASSAVEVLNGKRNRRDDQSPTTTRAIPAEDLDEAPSLREMIRAVLAPDSLIVHFALRVAIVTTVAVALTELLEIPRGYWVTLTVVVILQPYTGVTLTRAVQRVGGTVLGGLVAVALGTLFHDVRAILVIAALFVACCVALLPLNYAAFSVFLTPTFVLLAEASAGEWNLAWTRVADTVLGGALALLGARLLWPSPERERFPVHAAQAMRALRTYLEHAAEHFDDRSPQASHVLRSSRRAVGLATINAEESLQRALAEAHGDETVLAPALTLLAYVRRITASVAALVIARHAEAGRAEESLDAFVRVAGKVLDDLAEALEAPRGPLPLPVFRRPIASTADSPLVAARLERIARQVATLYEASQRLLPAGD